jgi:hypothetical protein
MTVYPSLRKLPNQMTDFNGIWYYYHLNKDHSAVWFLFRLHVKQNSLKQDMSHVYYPEARTFTSAPKGHQ